MLAVLTALASPQRLRIVAALKAGGRNYVSQLAREVGISRPLLHLHLQKLGTPKEGRDAARSGKLDKLFDIYERQLATPEAREQLDELTAIMRSGRPVCLLCYERDVNHCHRRRIAEVIHQRTGATVEHLAAPLY